MSLLETQPQWAVRARGMFALASVCQGLWRPGRASLHLSSVLGHAQLGDLWGGRQLPGKLGGEGGEPGLGPVFPERPLWPPVPDLTSDPFSRCTREEETGRVRVLAPELGSLTPFNSEKAEPGSFGSVQRMGQALPAAPGHFRLQADLGEGCRRGLQEAQCQCFGGRAVLFARTCECFLKLESTWKNPRGAGVAGPQELGTEGSWGLLVFLFTLLLTLWAPRPC